MAAVISTKNTFLCLTQANINSSCKRRSCSEEAGRISTLNEPGEALKEYLDGLQAMLCGAASPLRHAKVPDEKEDMHVIQSQFPVQSKAARPLGKIGQVSSISSISTMASEDDDTECCHFKTAMSSSSLSSLWCDEEDDTFNSDGCTNSERHDAVAKVAKPSPKESTHSLVPKKVNLVEKYAQNMRIGQGITTLMIRNISNRCSQRQLIEELEAVGLGGCFDFLYIPLDLGTMSNVGYAFVNFTHPEHATKCMEVLPTHQFQRQQKPGRAVVVVAAHMQGLDANLRHYEKSAVNTSRLRQRRPVVINVIKTVLLADCI